MDDLSQDCLLGISDCLPNKTSVSTDNIDDNETKIRQTIGRGRKDIIDALRQCLNESERKLQQQRTLIGRAIASLTNPESAGGFGVADWSNHSEATNQITAPSSSIVSANVDWQRVVVDTWVLLISVKTTSQTPLPCPVILLDHTESELPLTYRSHVIRSSFPSECCDDWVNQQQPSLTAADGLTLCVSVDVSQWTASATLHVFLSGSVPPYDTYQTSAGSITLSPRDRIKFSYQPLTCDISTCTALWSLCQHHHHVPLCVSSTASTLTTSPFTTNSASVGERVDWCLARGGCAGFSRCAENHHLLWANLNANHALFGCVVYVSDVGDVGGVSAAPYDSRTANSNSDNVADYYTDDNNDIDFSQEADSEVIGAVFQHKNTTITGAKQQQHQPEQKYRRRDETNAAHRCSICIFSRSASQLALIRRLLCDLELVRQLRCGGDNCDAPQALTDLMDCSDTRELDSLWQAIERQCTVASEMLSISAKDRDITEKGATSEIPPIGGKDRDVTEKGVASTRNTLTTSDLRFSAAEYSRWRERLQLCEMATARAIARVEERVQLSGCEKNR